MGITDTLEYRMDRVEERLTRIEERQMAIHEEIRAFGAGVRAIKWLGGVMIGLWVLAKTGDVSALKAVFGA